MSIHPHNYWYAVNNTEVVLMPANTLETFGTTNLHYHIVSELMDSVNQIRIREGTIRSRRPQIITPTYYENEMMEGFGEQANQYIQWLKTHAKDMHVLQYGFQIQKTELNEHIVTGVLATVLEQVKDVVKASNDPLAAVIQGVDDPWDVCLLKFVVDMVRYSAPVNFTEMGRRNLLTEERGVPRAVREELDDNFLKASRNPALIKDLNAKLRRYGLFEEYEDRFFALVKQSRP